MSFSQSWEFEQAMMIEAADNIAAKETNWKHWGRTGMDTYRDSEGLTKQVEVLQVKEEQKLVRTGNNRFFKKTLYLSADSARRWTTGTRMVSQRKRTLVGPFTLVGTV